MMLQRRRVFLIKQIGVDGITFASFVKKVPEWVENIDEVIDIAFEIA